MSLMKCNMQHHEECILRLYVQSTVSGLEAMLGEFQARSGMTCGD